MTAAAHRRPPGSFRGAPDGDKGGGGERTQGKAARAHTHNRQEERRTSGGKEGRREGHGWPRASGVEEEGNEEETRQQGGNRERDRQTEKSM